MDSIHISQCLSYLLKNTNTTYTVIARDQLPFVSLLRLPLCICVNTDLSSNKGLHWVGYYVKIYRGKTIGYFFDSYHNYYTFYNFKPSFSVIGSNTKVLQPQDSDTCGLWVVAWLYHMSQGKSVKSFDSEFTSNLKHNDVILLRKFCNLPKSCKTKGKLSCCPRTRNKH